MSLINVNPTLEVLERIKHLFSVKHVLFVLMHKRQLEKSVKCVYGQGIDASTYLQKFIHLECALPKDIGTLQSSDYGKYCRLLYRLHELKLEHDEHSFLESIIILSRHYELSLRQLERVFTHVTIYYSSIEKQTFRNPYLVPFLAIFKVRFAELYDRLKKGAISFNEFYPLTKLPAIIFPREQTPTTDERQLLKIGMWLKLCLLPYLEYANMRKDDPIISLEEHLFPYSLERQEIIPFLSKYLDIVSMPAAQD
jgi:hypothetical protein